MSGWCVRVQGDFPLSLGKDDSFWVSYRGEGEAPVHSKVRCTAEGGVRSEVEELVVERRGRGLHLRHTGSGREVRVVPPTEGVVRPGGDGQGLHVSEGGLGVSCDGECVLVWEVATGVVRRRLEGHLGQVYTCRLFPSGLVVLSGGADMRLRVASVEDGRCPVTLVGHTGAVTDSAIVDRGRLVTSVSRDGTARLWRLSDSTCLAVLADMEQVLTCCLLPPTSPLHHLLPAPGEGGGAPEEGGGHLLVVAGEGGAIAAIDVGNRQKVWEAALGSAVLCLAATAATLWAGCEDGALHSLTRVAGEVVAEVARDSTSPVTCLLALQGGLVVGRGDGTATLLPHSGTRVELCGGGDSAVTGLAASSSLLYISSREGRVVSYSLDSLMAAVA